MPTAADVLVRAVGRRIGEVRRARGLTQEQLAERINVATSYVARIEQGRQNISVKTIARFAHGLGVQAKVFFERPTEAKPRPGRRPSRT